MELHYVKDKEVEVHHNGKVIGRFWNHKENTPYKSAKGDGLAVNGAQAVYTIMRDYRQSIEGVEEDVK